MLILCAADNSSSKLEQLPIELLELIFVFSSNPLFVQVSKRFYELFKPTPSLKIRWLMNIGNGDCPKALYKGVKFSFFDKETLFRLDALYMQQCLRNSRNRAPENSSSSENPLPTFLPFTDRPMPYRLFSHPDPEGKLIEFARILLDRNASPDEPDGYPIVKSAAVGREDMVKLLLEYGANPNIKSGSAITMSVKSNRFPIVKLLVEKGGKPSAKDVKIAINSGNWPLAEYLARNGVEISGDLIRTIIEKRTDKL